MKCEYSGIDEAALGPILGPYCCGSVSFTKDNETELFDLFKKLSCLKICDSKKLYTSGKSIKALENTALTFSSYFLGYIPENLSDLISALIIDKKNLYELKKIPWFENIESLKLPIISEKKIISLNKDQLSQFMKKEDLLITSFLVDTVPAERFNSLLAKGLNKSQVCQQLISPLIKSAFTKNSRITVDRQGGRRYYGEWLVDLFPGTPVSIDQETRDLSTYTVNKSTIRFQVKGDDKYLETALASIISKYLRELLMICFNNYWQKKIPQLKRTAGYPLDGKRFIKDLISNKIPFEEHVLIRQK